jgi:hypothetical protein
VPSSRANPFQPSNRIAFAVTRTVAPVVGKDCRPQTRNADNRRHQKHRFLTEGYGNVSWWMLPITRFDRSHFAPLNGQRASTDMSLLNCFDRSLREVWTILFKCILHAKYGRKP